MRENNDEMCVRVLSRCQIQNLSIESDLRAHNIHSQSHNWYWLDYIFGKFSASNYEFSFIYITIECAPNHAYIVQYSAYQFETNNYSPHAQWDEILEMPTNRRQRKIDLCLKDLPLLLNGWFSKSAGHEKTNFLCLELSSTRKKIFFKKFSTNFTISVALSLLYFFSEFIHE